MSLFVKDEPGQTAFFSPAKIDTVQARQEELEVQKKQKKLEEEVEDQIKLRKRNKRLKKFNDEKIDKEFELKS